LIDEKLTDISDNKPPTLNAVSIKEKFSMFFNWLKMFDFNILLILIIVIFIAGLNMVTTLLVIILEKRQFIAIMKVLGSNHKKLQHIFLIQASYIISIGLLIGNLLGLGMIFIQKYFGVIKLDPENYYVKTAPVYIELKHILLLNLGVLIAILAMLLIPVLLVSKISPVKVLKYD
jgi:lipoprotein-releasing system permease protein